jgi:hypothetical protein
MLGSKVPLLGQSTPRRVHVIGGPGSGKTTLARQLAERVSVLAFDLDSVAYAAGAKRPLDERRADLSDIILRGGWITEGIYLWWVDDLLRSADSIVWLDISWRTAAWRIVLRHIRASLAGTNPHPGIPRLIRFLRSSRRYYLDASLLPPTAPDDDGAVSRARTATELGCYAGKLVRCRTSAAAARFLLSV